MSEPTFQYIHIDQLYVDPIVQRATDPARSKGIAAKFNKNAMGALIVNHRDDGKYFVSDGAHRLLGAKIAGYDGELLCIVHEGLAQADEAALFLLLNDSKLVGAMDKFRVRVMARDLVAVGINNTLEHYGWRVAAGNQRGLFAAVAAIERVYYGCGKLPTGMYPLLVDSVLQTITAAWEGNPAGAHAAIVGGLGELFARYGSLPMMDREKLVHEMSKTRPVDLVTRAKGIKESQGGTISAAMAKVLVGLHNKSRRTNRLPDWRWTT